MNQNENENGCLSGHCYKVRKTARIRDGFKQEPHLSLGIVEL